MFAVFVQITVQQIRVQGLPFTSEVREGTILDVVLCDFFIVTVVMVVFFLLHTLNGFFCFHGIAQHFQQIDDLHILVGGIFQSVIDPTVRFAADIDKEVAIRDFDNIISSGLVAVQVNTVVQ